MAKRRAFEQMKKAVKSIGFRLKDRKNNFTFHHVIVFCIYLFLWLAARGFASVCAPAIVWIGVSADRQL